ncbi:hypothetical protein DL765_004217 [Monosporascus sp. GIB2]|nr:hypothetical protein DL765_004217 [Monosporascus sp. GIB2]
MLGAHVQSVLRCGQCNKPFDKQSTLKRHGYYCQSRHAGSTSRPRSCISCARAKAGCDNKRPECSRCIAKAIECHYPANTHRATGPGTRQSHDAATDRGKLTPSSVASSRDRQDSINSGDTILDGALVLPDPDLANLGAGYLEWGISDLLNTQTNNAQLSPASPSLAGPRTAQTDRTAEIQQSPCSPANLSIPAAPSCAVRSLNQRPRRVAGAQRIANLILHTLKSYPLMILRDNTLPTFIHPTLLSSDVKNGHMEPLNNCISLMRMISNGVQGSRKLFWKNVRLECERLSQESEHSKFTKWDLLAAMQALSIYIIIRLEEGETEHNDVDFLLVKTVIIIAKQFARGDITCHMQCALCNGGLGTGWKELTLVYRVINMLIYFEPAAVCDLPTELLLAPLPAKKALWEAADEFAWKAEGQWDPGAQIAFGLAADGGLVKLDEGRLSCSDAWLCHQSMDAGTPPWGPASWEEWCAGMDGLGGLVMLAASLVELESYVW